MVAEANLSGIIFLKPILAFLVVFFVLVALMIKSKILGDDSKFLPVFIAFSIATVFAVSGGARNLILEVFPWFGVILIVLFMVMVLAGFIGKTGDIVGKGMGLFFIIILLIIVFISGARIFGSSIGHYIPGPNYGIGGDPQLLFFFDWFWSPSVFGAFIFIIITISAMWFVMKGK